MTTSVRRGLLFNKPGQCGGRRRDRGGRYFACRSADDSRRRKPESAARGPYQRSFVSFPVAAPLFVVVNAIEKLLFRDFAGHPAVENLLVPRKYGFDGEHDITVVRSTSSSHEICSIDSESWRARDSRQSRSDLRCVPLQESHRASQTDSKGLEFSVELLDVLPAWRGIEFTDVALDSLDGRSLERRDLSKSFL